MTVGHMISQPNHQLDNNYYIQISHFSDISHNRIFNFFHFKIEQLHGFQYFNSR